MKIALVSALLGVQLVVPIADRVPTLKVDSSCKAAASINKSMNLAESQSYENCMKDENSARDQLNSLWTSFSAAERESCTAEASNTGGGSSSYVDLLVCLQMAHDADALKTTTLKGARTK
jgi:hypothetical protein